MNCIGTHITKSIGTVIKNKDDGKCKYIELELFDRPRHFVKSVLNTAEHVYLNRIVFKVKIQVIK